jgi:hypothetical protein
MDTLTSYLNWNIVTAALAVVAVVLIVLLAFRALGGNVRGRRGARLAISEYHEVDKTRRLVLIRRDEVEHLLMIGGAQDLVIETGIGLAERDIREEEYQRPSAVTGPAFASPPQPPRPEQPDEHAPVPLRAAPRPAVFGERTPKLRPVTRDEPRLTSTHDYGSEEKS